MHDTELSVSEDFNPKDVAKENHFIKGAEVGKESELENDVTKALLVATEEKYGLVHEAEISVASIPVQGRKEEA